MPIDQKKVVQEILQSHGITVKEASKLLNVSIDTVKAYLVNPSSKRYRTISADQLKFLRQQAQKRTEALSDIHEQFDSVLNKLESFALQEYGKREELAAIYPLDEKQKSAERFYGLIDEVNDVWISYTYCDLDSLPMRN